jgi:hypothetical protein
MPEFDAETIAALAEGRLDPERAGELERAIASDPDAAADLAAQRAALAAVTSAPLPTLSPAERSGLRAAVAEAIGVTATPAQSPSPARRVPWGAIGVAAAALAALVAVVPLAGLLRSSGGSALTTTAAAFEAPTTTVALLGPQEDATLGTTQAPSVTEPTGAASAPETTVAGATAENDGGDQSRVLDAFDKAYTTATAAIAADTTTPCAVEASAALGTTTLYTVDLEDETGAIVVVLYAVGEDGSVTAIGYDPVDCAVVFTTP